MTHFTFARLLLLVLLLSLHLHSLHSAESVKAPKKDQEKKSRLADAFFEGTNIPVVRIEIAPEKMAILRKYHFRWRGEEPMARESVPATVKSGDQVWTNVSLHLKGAAGSFRSVDQNPALTLNFDKEVKGQHFHGLEKLSLNNSVQDPTFVMEKFARELFLQAGVPAPRAGHVRFYLNGKDLGLYGLTEGWNKDFLKLHFKNSSGNLYDGGFLKDVGDDLALNSGNNPDRSRLKQLVEAAQEPNLTNRFDRLEKVLDMDRFLTFLAVEVLLWDWDGYGLNHNNFRIYHDPDSNKLVFLPHGKDQLFWVPEGPILPPMKGLVARNLMQTPEGRKRYLAKLGTVTSNYFHAEKLTNRVQQLASRVRPVLAEKNPQAVKNHEREISSISQQISDRARSVREQLSAPSRMLQFNESGLALLGGWKSKTDFGKPLFEESKDGGKILLRVSAEKGSSVGSWRTRVFLEPGQYRLEGKIKTQGIATDPGDTKGGVGIRTGNKRLVQKFLGTADWTPATFDFEVGEQTGDMEILCELRAAKGEAWFDASSFKLMKR